MLKLFMLSMMFLKKTIKLQAVSPGRVETDIFVNSSYTVEESRAIFNSLKSIQPCEIADSVDYILSAPQHVQVRISVTKT